MKSIAEIRARREPLVAEAARQRGNIEIDFVSLKGPAALAERGLGVIGWLRQHPLAVGAAAAVLVAVRPRRALSLAARGLFLWRALLTIRGLLREMGASA